MTPKPDYGWMSVAKDDFKKGDTCEDFNGNDGPCGAYVLGRCNGKNRRRRIVAPEGKRILGLDEPMHSAFLFTRDGKEWLPSIGYSEDNLTVREWIRGSPTILAIAVPISEEKKGSDENFRVEHVGHLPSLTEEKNVQSGASPALEVTKEPLRSPATQEQPLPSGKGRDIAKLVQHDIELRAIQGLHRYGERLKPHNGRNALVDAYQEALDLAMYLRQAIEELEPVPEVTKEPSNLIAKEGTMNPMESSDAGRKSAENLIKALHPDKQTSPTPLTLEGILTGLKTHADESKDFSSRNFTLGQNVLSKYYDGHAHGLTNAASLIERFLSQPPPWQRVSETPEWDKSIFTFCEYSKVRSVLEGFKNKDEFLKRVRQYTLTHWMYATAPYAVPPPPGEDYNATHELEALNKCDVILEGLQDHLRGGSKVKYIRAIIAERINAIENPPKQNPAILEGV